MNVIADNYRSVIQKIHVSADKAGRRADHIKLVAVSKKKSIEDIKSAYLAGARDFGENYAQELTGKYDALHEKFADIRWHFIGRIQSNKIKYIVGRVEMIHSVDSLRSIQEIEARTAAKGLGRMPVLIEVNMAGEARKGGVKPGDLWDLIKISARSEGIALCGLMTMPPWDQDPESSRPFFRRLRELFEECRRKLALHFPERLGDFIHLSMGMSGDMEIAIEEGATIVRVGTAIFGERE